MEEFYYQHFNKAEQGVYYAILKGIRDLSTEFLIPACEPGRLHDIFFQLRLDHPEIFWATGYRYRFYRDSPNLIFCPEYLFQKDKILEHQKAMSARVQKIVRPMADMTELEKEKYVHDFICENVRYDKLKKSYSHEVIGPLGQGVGVCEGIAKSVKILLDAANVWNIIVLCGNNPEKGIKYRHVWNVVRIGGTYYHMDATFDDTLTGPNSEKANFDAKNGKNNSDEAVIRYDYFNLADKQIFRDHEPLIAPAPKCSDGDHFYYREKKMSFTKEEEVYKRALQAAKKKKTLVFHWRGGYFTRDIFQELVHQVRKAGEEKNMAPYISANFAQAVMKVRFREPEKLEEIILEDANISEKYEEHGE